MAPMLGQIVNAISIIINVYSILIIIWCVVSMVAVNIRSIGASHPLVVALDRLTAPVIRPIRRMLPGSGGGLDLSPVLAIFLLRTIDVLIVRSAAPFM